MASPSGLRGVVAVVIGLAAFLLPAFQAYHATLTMPWAMRCAYMGESDAAHLIGTAASSLFIALAAGGLGYVSRRQRCGTFLLPGLCVAMIGVAGAVWSRVLLNGDAHTRAIAIFGDSAGLAVLSFAPIFPAVFATLSFIVARQFARRVPSRWGIAASFGGALGIQMLAASVLLGARLSHCA